MKKYSQISASILETKRKLPKIPKHGIKGTKGHTKLEVGMLSWGIVCKKIRTPKVDKPKP